MMAQVGLDSFSGPRHNERGMGAHYTIKNPGPMHLLILKILDDNRCYDLFSAVSLNHLFDKVKTHIAVVAENEKDNLDKRRLLNYAKYMKINSFSGRMSECTGMQWTAQTQTRVEEKSIGGTIEYHYVQVDEDGSNGCAVPCHFVTVAGKMLLEKQVKAGRLDYVKLRSRKKEVLLQTPKHAGLPDINMSVRVTMSGGHWKLPIVQLLQAGLIDLELTSDMAFLTFKSRTRETSVHRIAMDSAGQLYPCSCPAGTWRNDCHAVKDLRKIMEAK